ncbi:TolB-like translocation protein [Aquimarina sediminis]|uniref:hypothetical protein n=1 Tax=Aquimarina sediminis TaxID=2070536 RepID=UPI000CA0461B|nr:hypothetical protein [Aquimarina sediminis]
MKTQKTKLVELPKQEQLEEVWINLVSKRVAYSEKSDDINKSRMVIDGEAHLYYDDVRDLKFSKDGKEYAYVAKNDDEYFIIKNGKKIATHSFIGFNSLRWSPDNYLAYTISKDNGYYVVYKQDAFGPFESKQPKEGYNVPLFSFHPQTFDIAYAAKIKDKWAVEISGKRLREYDMIMDLSFNKKGEICYRFKKDEYWGVYYKNEEISSGYDLITDIAISPDGKRIGFIAKKDNKWYAALDRDKGEMYDSASQPMFSEDNQVFAFHGYTDTSPEDDDEYDDDASYDNYFVVINWQPQKPYDNTMGLAISKDSKKIAYVASKEGDNDCFVVVNEVEMKPYSGVDHFSLKFSPDGHHLGYLAFDNSMFEDGKKSIVVIDSKESEPFDGVYSEISFVDDSKKAVYVALQENSLYWIEHTLI